MSSADRKPRGRRSVALAGSLMLAAGTWSQSVAAPVDLDGATGGADQTTTASSESPRIRHILIECEDVFSDAEKASFLYRTADALHWTTRQDFIRRELLFSEQDVVDPSNLRETERNLRRYQSLRSAEISTLPVGADQVDVLVSTQDSWTTALGVTAGSAGGHFHFGFSGEESNLLGEGRQLRFAMDSGAERTRRQIRYGDPYFMRSPLSLDLQYDFNSDGTHERFALARPFRSLESRWEGLGSYEDGTSETRLYTAGLETGRFGTHTRHVELKAGWRLTAPRAGRVLRLGAGYRWEEASYRTITPPTAAWNLAPDRRFGFILGSLEFLAPDFLVQHNVNRLSRAEDFDLGTLLTAELGYSPPLLGAQAAVEGSIELSRGRRVPGGFLVSSIAAHARHAGDGIENALVTGRLFSTWRSRAVSAHTLVAGARWDVGWNLDGAVQLAADGSNGLRGYKLHAFTGDRRFIMNLEDRILLTPEIAHLVQLSAAAFLDAGRAWSTGSSFVFEDLGTDVGAGLRIGLPRASRQNIWRIDVAYPLRPDLTGRQAWMLSFSSSQAF